MGPSEARTHINSPTMGIQEGLNVMSFSQTAQGVGNDAVVHNMLFDPRSPIHRGTRIPAGYVSDCQVFGLLYALVVHCADVVSEG